MPRTRAAQPRGLSGFDEKGKAGKVFTLGALCVLSEGSSEAIAVNMLHQPERREDLEKWEGYTHSYIPRGKLSGKSLK